MDLRQGVDARNGCQVNHYEIINPSDRVIVSSDDELLACIELADAIDAYGGLANFFRGRPRYDQFFGLWLNKRRIWYRRAGIIAFGSGIAMGNILPGDEYWDAQADGEMEAKVMKARHNASQTSENG